MQREEQIKLMKKKIIDSAIEEFNKCGYDKASMNQICKKGQISKGIIYHYFQDKEELYLACLKECYGTLLYFYKEYREKSKDIDIQEYMQVRMQFFREYPKFRGLFLYSLLKTPVHLKDRVDEIRKELNNFNIMVYKEYLKKLNLRVSEEKAIMYLDICQNSYNDYFRKMFADGENIDVLIERHEEMIPEWIDFMLYGIAKEK